MNSFKVTFFLAILFAWQVCSANGAATDVTPTTAAKDREQAGWFQKTTDEAVNTVENLYENGRLSMILSGYAHHGRGTYSQARLNELNEKVWGLGMSKELRDNQDNEESIQILIMADSHYKPQMLASYNYQWMKSLGGQWEAGIGFALGFASRADFLGGIPIPGILPLGSIGTRDTKLILSYIPRIQGDANGDVLFLGLRINLK